MAQKVIVDASVALSWVLPGEAFQETRNLRDRAIEDPDVALLVPPTFWYEVSNALWVGVRRGRLDHRNAIAALEALMDFRFQSWAPDPRDCLSLAVKHGIAVYDSVYMQAALETESSLWTIDRPLAQAATGAAVPVEPSLDRQVT